MDKLYIIINSDLDLTPGQIAAQISHITQLIVEHVLVGFYESNECESYTRYSKWRLNPVTIIKKASGRELENLLDRFPNLLVKFYDEIKVRDVVKASCVLTGIGLNMQDYPEELIKCINGLKIL